MQKKVIFTLLTALIGTSCVIYSTAKNVAKVNAQATSSAETTTQEEDQEVTENLKKRLQATINQTEVAPVNSYRSYVGVIRDVIKNTAVIEDKDGKKNVMISDDAAILRSPGNAVIKAENIRIEDYIIAIGTIKEPDEMDAVRVIVSTNPLSTTNKTAEAAKITNIKGSTLTLTPLSGSDEQIATLNSKSTLKNTLGESLESDDLSVGDSVIYTAIVSKDSSSITSLMRIGFADPDASPNTIPDSN